MSGNSFSFVHCSDLHLDSPFTGIASSDPRLAKMLVSATFHAFERVVDIAIEEGADFIVISGDIYDQGDGSIRAQLGFRDILQRALDRGIECFMVHGNHDPLDSWRSGISFPPAVHRFGQEVEKKIYFREGQACAEIYGISYKKTEEFRNLASLFNIRDGSALFKIGLLHCNLGGSSPGHQNYSPCSLADLVNTGIDYWALGHIHMPGVIRGSEPAVVYSGNIQGRHIGEKGKRGCYLVEVEDSKVMAIQFHSTSQILWSEAELDLSSVNSAEELVDSLRDLCDIQRSGAEGLPSILRVILKGESEVVPLLENLDFQKDLLDLIRENEKRKLDQIWIESIKNMAHLPLDRDRLRKGNDFIADFLELCDMARKDPSMAADMIRQDEAFKLVQDFLADIETPEVLGEILDEAEKIGLTGLLGGDKL